MLLLHHLRLRLGMRTGHPPWACMLAYFLHHPQYGQDLPGYTAHLVLLFGHEYGD